MNKEFLNLVESRLPEFCSRRDAEKAMEGLLKARTLANLDSKGIGPGGKLLAGKTVYSKMVFLSWLQSYLDSHHSLQRVTKKEVTEVLYDS